MPYENDLLLFNLHRKEVIKFSGHRSYIANTIYHNDKKEDILITCGMDHRISLLKIKEKHQLWLPVQKGK